jgi:RNA polymerase sigma factor (sigma-70 family)
MAAPVAESGPQLAARRLAELDQRCGRGLFLVAMRALGDEDDAHDAVQETLARAVEAIRADRVPLDVPLLSFVHGIARHVVADQIRRRVRHHTTGLDPEAPIASPDAAPLDAMVRDEDRLRLAIALRQLPHDDLEFLRRCYTSGEALVSLAASLGVPHERVRKRKSRIIERLRALLRVRGHGSLLPTTEET